MSQQTKMKIFILIVSLTARFCFAIDMANQCPESFFYYYDNEAFLNSPKAETEKIIFNHFKLKKTQTDKNEAQGAVWEIARHAYDACCKANNLKLIQLADEIAVSERMFQKTNSNHLNQGIFLFSNTLDSHYGFNEYSKSIRLLTSSSKYFFSSKTSHCFNLFLTFVLLGFYLIAKRDHAGSSIVTPIALEILLNSWPILLFISIANAYAAIFIWFMVSFILISEENLFFN